MTSRSGGGGGVRKADEVPGGAWRRNLEEEPGGLARCWEDIVIEVSTSLSTGDKACVKYELHKVEIKINSLDLKYVFPQSRWGKP